MTSTEATNVANYQEYIAEAPTKAIQCGRIPHEIFADRKRKRWLEDWRKVAAKDCPNFELNERTHQLAAYFDNERYIVAFTENGIKKNTLLYVVDSVSLITPSCRKVQKQLLKCIDGGKELVECLLAIPNPAPPNCPTVLS